VKPLVQSVLVAALLSASAGGGQTPSQLAIAQANGNQVAAGELRSGVLSLHLDMVETTWYPEQDGGPSLHVYAFTEPGKTPQIPGPLVRVPQGTEIHATVHNSLPAAMYLRGLHTHESPASEPVRIAPGETADVRFTARVPGTYYYSARSTRATINQVASLSVIEDLPMGEAPFEVESQLQGGFVVDPPGGVTGDRIFVISLWMKGVLAPPFREVAAINGKSWPYTERLAQRLGEPAHWRVLNPSMDDHALHLHGFYFRVNSMGDGERDEARADNDASPVVTQHLLAGGTMSLTWTPDRAGQWLFHCHMTSHMMEPSLASYAVEGAPHSSEHGDSDSPQMRGLIVGVTVAPGGGPVEAKPASDLKPRRLRLLIREKAATRFSLARMGYVVQEGDGSDNPEGLSVPGPPLVLTRGQLTEIEVVNQLHEPTAVHWHGIELESYYDGVPGWSGGSPQITPSIPPGGTFLARMTPPRAGTFIYHTHWHDVAQLTSGLYGPLIVLDPGQEFSPDVDKTFVISRSGPDSSESPLLLNGTPQPPPLVLKAGTKYRFRLINIGTDDSDATVSLRGNSRPVSWRRVAKDGWTLSSGQALQPAEQVITVGETYDFEFAPDMPGELTLEVSLGFLRTQVSQFVVVR
jgi:FtsP/CotA-like multicopper oxidase with cupredoxin domain